MSLGGPRALKWDTEEKGPFSGEKREKELESGGQKHFSAENSRDEDQSG